MKCMKKDLKEKITIIKRFMGKDKEAARFVMQGETDGTILFYTKNEKQTVIFLSKIEGDIKEEFSIFINPYQMDEWTKGKNVQIEFIFNDTTLTETSSGKEVPYEVNKNRIKMKIDEMQPFEDSDRMLQILKEAEHVLKKNTYISSDYLCLTSQKVIAAEPGRIHIYRIDEKIESNMVFLPKEGVSLVSKSLKGKIEHGILGNAFVFKNGSNYFLVKKEDVKGYPKLNNLDDFTLNYSFSLSADSINSLTKSYTTKLKKLEIRFEHGEMIMDPRQEGFPRQTVAINKVLGKLSKKIVFEAESFKGMFQVFKDDIRVECCEFKNVYGEDALLWKVYTKDKYTLLACEEEPDYEIQERMFAEKKFKELSENAIEKA